VVNGLNTSINNANPLFNSPSSPNFDYGLKSGSPATDGATGSGVTVDITNKSRTGTADLGAFEFGTVNSANPSGFSATGGDSTTGAGGFPAASRPPTISPIANPPSVTAGQGAIAPVTFTIADPDTPLANLQLSVRSTNPALVPAGSVAFGGTGGSKTAQVTASPNTSGTATITITVSDGTGASATSTFTVTVLPGTTPTGPSPVLVNYRQFGVGADSGGGTATLFNPDKSAQFTVAAFPNFAGGTRTAAADFNRDGIADLVVGTGPGRATRVRILDGVTQTELFGVDAFEPSFTGGVYVIAGDVTGDGIPELAITPDEGGGPRVDIYNGSGFGKIASFFGIDDPNFRGGARAAIADLSGDGRGDIVVVAGFGGGPRVAAFDGKSLATASPTRLFGDFFAFEQTLRNGIFVAAGDVNGDGVADLVAGGGPGGGPRVTVFDGKNLLNNTQVQVANFFGGDPNSRGGIRVSVKNLDNDRFADVVVGSGAGSGSRVTSYLGSNLATGNATASLDFDAFAGFGGGVFVG
jgi:FG-GAP repeat